MRKIYTTLLLLACTLMMCMPAFVYAQVTEDRWWGYCQEDDALAGFSTGQVENFSCAIFVEGNRGTGMGKSFSTVRLALQGCQSVENLKVWISKTLPETPDQASVMTIDVDASQMTEGEFFEVELPEACAISQSGLYVGYSFDTKKGATGTGKKAVLSTTGVPSLPNGFFLKSSKTYKEWRDLQSFNRGNLAMQLLLHGEFIDNGVSIVSFDETPTLPDQDVPLLLVMRNRGVNGVSSIDFTLERDGQPFASEHWTLPEPITIVGDYFGLNMLFHSPKTSGLTRFSISIEKVNDVENEVTTESKANGGLVTITESAQHNVLMEEVTGTWCMWCPRGAVAIEHLTEDYPGRFVGIAIHGNDIMEIPEYYNVKSQVPGLPGCLIDRTYECDPFEGQHGGSYGIHYDIEAKMEELCPAAVELFAEWGDADSTVIKLRSEVTLQYDRDDDPPYRLAYVLVADSLCGDGADWIQHNGFSNSSFTDYTNDPYLAPLTEYSSLIIDYKYNDVAIATYGIEEGLEGSVTGPFQMGLSNSHEYQINISGNRLVQDKSKLKVVAILLDTNTGKVVNCDCTPVSGNQTDGIRTLKAENTHATRRYTLDGRQLPASAKYQGVFIEVK